MQIIHSITNFSPYYHKKNNYYYNSNNNDDNKFQMFKKNLKIIFECELSIFIKIANLNLCIITMTKSKILLFFLIYFVY